MTVYLGLPLTYEEAIRILGLNIDHIISEIKVKYKYLGNYYDPYIIEELNEYLRVSTKIRICPTDKGQCIIGYEIEEPSDVWNKFINVDEFIVKIINLKTQFIKEIEILKADLSQVTLEHMEGEPEVIKNPIPYIISYN
jgi:hypothetical protein